MIVFDENAHQKTIMNAVAAWYRGRVVSITVLRPGSVIKDDVIPTLLRRVKQATFFTQTTLFQLHHTVYVRL